MPNEDACFTKQEIGKAIGISRQAVSKSLKATPATGWKIVGGRRTPAWRLRDLPDPLRERLQATLAANPQRYRDKEHLLRMPPDRCEPEVPLVECHPEDVGEAEAIRAMLAPILRRHHERRAAEIVRQVRAAHPELAASDGTLRRWLDTAKKRDGGNHEWDRTEIYLTGQPRRPVAPREDGPELFGTLAHALSSVADPAMITDLERTEIYQAACAEAGRLIQLGWPKVKAISAILDTLQWSRVEIAQCRAGTARVRPALYQTLCRYLERLKADPKSAFIDRRRKVTGPSGNKVAAPGRTKEYGRKPLAVLNEEEEQKAKALYVETESKTTALRLFADSPVCRPEVAAVINQKRGSKHTITKTLRAQIDVPAQVIAYHKSPKDVRVNGFNVPRTKTYIDGTGTEKEIMPGDLFERDDMSNNFLCWVPWPWGGDPCSDRYGVRVARGQNLMMIDVASLFFTSFNFLIRLRDSYRANDIWAWIGHTYRDIGLPRIGERWERGTWASKRLRGDKKIPIEAGHTTENERLGGMTALGLKVIESHSPTTKIIENRFNYFQTICATIRGQIGRKRGEMERTQKIWTACQLGHRDPRDYFLSFDQINDEIEKKIHWMNQQPVEGAVYHGVPEDLWGQHLAAHPLQPVTPEKSYLFARDKRDLTINSAGEVRVSYTSPDGYKGRWHFTHPDLWRRDGQKVAVYFDRYLPSEGATVVLQHGPDAGRAIQVTLVDGCPQFARGLQTGDDTAASDAMLSGLDRKRAFTDAVISEYRALGIKNTRLARICSVDDGAGRQRTIDESAAAAADAESRQPSESRSKVLAKEAHAKHRGRGTKPEEPDTEALVGLVRRPKAEAIVRGDLVPADGSRWNEEAIKAENARLEAEADAAADEFRRQGYILPA